MGQDEYPDMLTAKEVAELFGVSTAAARRWAHSGILQAIRPFGKHLFPRDQELVLAQIALVKGVRQE